MAVAARKLARVPRRALSEAQLMRLVRFPAVRRAISGGLDRATPEKVHIPVAGAFIRFRLEDPAKYHPALFTTLRRGTRGTLIIIGTPHRQIKRKAAFAAFLRRMGWDPRARRWGRKLSPEERRSMIYQLRDAGIIGGSRAQAVLVPRARVESVAARFLTRPALRKVVGNPILATLGIGNPSTSETQRRQLLVAKVTLDGEPATISGVKEPFAKVRSLVSSRQAEWSWEAAKRIVEQGGKFRSNPRRRKCPPGMVRSRSGKCVRPAGRRRATGNASYAASHNRQYKIARGLYDHMMEAVRAADCGLAQRRIDLLHERVAIALSMKGVPETVKRSLRSLQKKAVIELSRCRRRTSAKRNPGGAAVIRVPFRSGQKVTPAQMRRWLESLPEGPVKRQIVARFAQALRQYKRFHLGSEPRHFTYRPVPMGSAHGITDVDVVVSEGKEWAAAYQVPRHSRKHEGDGSDGRYVHAHGESKMEIDIRRPARKSLLPERFHTADGKFVGVIPTRNVTITDWYRG